MRCPAFFRTGPGTIFSFRVTVEPSLRRCILVCPIINFLSRWHFPFPTGRCLLLPRTINFFPWAAPYCMPTRFPPARVFFPFRPPSRHFRGGVCYALPTFAACLQCRVSCPWRELARSLLAIRNPILDSEFRSFDRDPSDPGSSPAQCRATALTSANLSELLC